MSDRYWLPEHCGSGRNQPVLSVSLRAVVGLTTAEASLLCRSDGFDVEIIEHDVRDRHDNLSHHSIRLRVRDGRVVSAAKA